MSDRSLLHAKDVLALHPPRYQWAWDMYLAGMDNHWPPREIQMASDVFTFKNPDTPDDFKKAFLAVMAMLTTFDVKRGQDAGETTMGLFEAPEIKQYYQRMIDEEALHTWAYQYCIENLQLDQMEIYRRYQTVPSMAARVAFADDKNWDLAELQRDKLTAKLNGEKFIWSVERLQKLYLGIAFWSLMFEGIWFVMSLTGPIQAMARLGGKPFESTAEQFQYILRDETLHITFGSNILSELAGEYPAIFENGLVYAKLAELIEEVVKLEDDYVDYVLPTPILGYSAEVHKEMTRYVAARRIRQLGLKPWGDFAEAKNVLPWLSEMLELKKEKNFFESRVTEYRKLTWDD